MKLLYALIFIFSAGQYQSTTTTIQGFETYSACYDAGFAVADGYRALFAPYPPSSDKLKFVCVKYKLK